MDSQHAPDPDADPAPDAATPDAAAPDAAAPAAPAGTPRERLGGALEALLLLATEPIGTPELAQALGVPVPEVWQALDALRAFYDQTGRGFELREVGGGWRYYTRPEHHDAIAAWLLEGQHGRLSQAGLETLAVVAYLQPVSRSRVSSVRGVNVDGVMRTLVTRDLIEEAGRDAETGALLFRTTGHFLERMGLTSLADLPPIAPHLPEASALEAELVGLAGLPGLAAPSELGEDGGMPDPHATPHDLVPDGPQPDAPAPVPAPAADPQGAPSAQDASRWADEQASELRERRDARPAGGAVPDAGELDRLSEPD